MLWAARLAEHPGGQQHSREDSAQRREGNMQMPHEGIHPSQLSEVQLGDVNVRCEGILQDPSCTPEEREYARLRRIEIQSDPRWRW